MSLKDDVKLDITKLDEAALNQPSLYAEWGEKWADAVLKRDQLKEELSTIRSEADESIRKSPKSYGWEADKAPTEAWISSQLNLHKKVKKANDEFIEAQYEVNMMTVAKESLDHRKRALEILTDLYSSNYFIAKSRSGKDYVETLTSKGAEEQQKVLDDNPRVSRRRRSE